MGADFVTMESKAKNTSDLAKDFRRQIASDKDENGHRDGYSGDFQCFDGMEITDEVFDTYQEAEDYVEANGEKWGAAVAVKYGKEQTWLVGGWVSC